MRFSKPVSPIRPNTPTGNTSERPDRDGNSGRPEGRPRTARDSLRARPSGRAGRVSRPARRRCRSAPPTGDRRAPRNRPSRRASATPCRARPSSRAGVVAQTVAASTIDNPISRTSIRNARSIVSTLPAMVPSWRNAADSRATIGWPPSDAREPGGRPDSAVPSVIAMIRDVPLAAIAVRTSAGCT